MNDRAKFQAICSELRTALGKDASAKEVLECAKLVFDHLEDDLPVDASFCDGRRTIDQTPLYEIFEKYPWQVYSREPMEITDY